MRTLVIYESKHGSTKKCVDYIISNKINIDIYKASIFDGNLSDYNQILVASSVYMGQFQKSIKQFFVHYEDILLDKPLHIIYCGMNKAEIENVPSQNMSSKLIEHANIQHVGGAYNFKSMNFLERFIVKKLAKVKDSLEDIHYDKLNQIKKIVT